MILQKHVGAPLTEVWGTNHSRAPTGSTKICISSTQSSSLVIHPFSLPFITISPYEWTLPFPSFLEDLHHHQYGKDVTDLPILETILIAHVLEQIARGHLTRGNCNRWNTLVFANATHPNAGNLKTYFPPRLGQPATPSMASQPQHLLDQTKGIRSRQIPCWCQVRVSIQSHVLLPASHNEPSSSFSF